MQQFEQNQLNVITVIAVRRMHELSSHVTLPPWNPTLSHGPHFSFDPCGCWLQFARLSYRLNAYQRGASEPTEPLAELTGQTCVTTTAPRCLSVLCPL